MSIIGVTIHSIMALVLSFSTSPDQQQLRQKAASEVRDQTRAIADEVSRYLESSGADPKGIFTNGPMTTSSLIPIPQASANIIRLRSDADGNGILAFSCPEDVIIAWNPPAKTLKVGPHTYTSVSKFALVYFNGEGHRLIPPIGGWNVSRDAWTGNVLRSIARVEVQVELENSQIPAPEAPTIRYEVTANAGIAHSLNLMANLGAGRN